MIFEFDGPIWYWRGPAPWYFVTVPEEQCEDLKEMLSMVTYGWGMIPAKVRIGETEWMTSLFSQGWPSSYPLRTDVRRAEGLEEGDRVRLRLAVG